jgi:hypothetical protein
LKLLAEPGERQRLCTQLRLQVGGDGGFFVLSGSNVQAFND